MTTSLTAGEIYIIGEIDGDTGSHTGDYKIGLVKETRGRFSADRLREHQTGNPRQLVLLHTVTTQVVRAVETALHGMYAPLRISGEWFTLTSDQKDEVLKVAHNLAAQAQVGYHDLTTVLHLADIPSVGDVSTPSAAILEAHQRGASLRCAANQIKQLMTMLKAPLENNIQANEQTNRFGYITQRSDSYIFDEKAFRSTYEDLWTRYQIDSPDISSYFRWHDKGDIPHQFDEPTCLTEEAALLLGRPLDDDILDDIHDLYLKLLTIQASVTWEKRLVEASIKAKCGTSPGIDGVCTWRRTLTHRQKLDLDTLRTEQPDIHSQFLVARAGAKALVVAKGRNFRRSRRHR